MDLGLSESQQMLKSSAREFLERECPPTYVRAMEEDAKGFTDELWDKVVGLGWTALPFPEQYGGMGGSFLDLCVLLEEMGRSLLPGPFFSTVVLGGATILDAGSEQQKQEFLTQIAEGKLFVTLALTEPSGTYEPWGVQAQAQDHGDVFTLTGTKLFVPDAHVADYLIVAARTRQEQDPSKGITLFLVPTRTQGVSVTPLKTIASDKQFEVQLQEVRVPRTAVLGRVHEGWPIVQRALERAAAATCVQMVGGAQMVLDMTVEYAKQRVQFGRPIGSFQAIQHHCANMATDVEGSRFIAYQAAWKVSEGEPATREVAMAKAWVSEAYRRVCALAHQSHGAIGFTKEHNLQLYTRRAKAAEVTYGDAAFHRELVAQEIGL